MIKDFQEIYYTEKEILEACERLGQELTNDYDGKKPVFIGFLKGCHPFMSDLLKQVKTPCTIDYMDVTSYHGGRESSGEVKIIKDVADSISDRHVVIVEDIIDSGRTLVSTIEYLKSKNPASIKVVTLLDKPEGRVVDCEADYV